MKKNIKNLSCPCCSGKKFTSCCQPCVEGKKKAETPEALMRSRYTAYSLGKIDYIQKTMCKKAAENYDPVSAKRWAKSVKWLKLKVLDVSIPAETSGTVTFTAYFLDNNQERSIFEKSVFEKIDGKWFYVDAQA